MMDEDTPAHMAFHELGQAWPGWVFGFVGGQARGFVRRDQPVVLEENAQGLSRFPLREPIKTSHEHRWPPTEKQPGIAHDTTANRHQAGEDGPPGQAAWNRSPERKTEFRGEPAIKRNHRVLADHDGDGLH